MNSAIDNLDAVFEGRASSSLLTVWKGTALGISLLVARAQAEAIVPSARMDHIILAAHHEQAAHAANVAAKRSFSLVAALLDFHDRLVASQEEFPEKALEVLRTGSLHLYERG
jgi:hypothetical protein